MSPLPRAYAPLAAFTAPARQSAEIWRTLGGTGAIAVIYLVAGWALVMLLLRSMSDIALLRLMQEVSTGSTPRGLILLLATFAPMLLAAIFVTRRFHNRSAATLFGPGTQTALRKLLPPLIGLALFTFGLTILSEHAGKSNPISTVLTWAPMALPLLAVQITAEEAIFRGYLLQQLGARWQRPWAWMVLPSALFAVLHFSPSEYGGNAIWPVLWAFAYGCLAADITARTGNLGAALAFHFANNFGSLFLVGFYGQLDGLSLYTIVINTRDLFELMPWLVLDALSILIAWLVMRLALRV